MKAQDILNFWFKELEPKQWWVKDLNLDRTIEDRFARFLSAAKLGEFSAWRDSAKGRLAEIIVLDQFSRNIFRNQPESFAADAQALTLSQEAVRAGVMGELNEEENAFLLMPFMHSESKLIHEQAMGLFESYAPYNLEYEQKHKVIIDRFGRYPHRNDILGRDSSEEELAFLKGPNSSF